MDEACEVIITAPDADWLAAFARRLVDDRLCAAAHNITQMRTIYRWGGEVHDKTEARVALHTRRSLVGRIADRTRSEHPYEVPCVVAVPIVAGNPDYLRWIMDETEAGGL